MDYQLQLVGIHDEGNHDLGMGFHPFCLKLIGRFKYGLDLHLIYLGVRHCYTATPMAEHRVKLLEPVTEQLYLLGGHLS